MPTQITVTSLHHLGVEHLRKRWASFLGLGILLVILGLIAVGASTLVTLATILFFGWLMVIGGVLQAIHAVISRQWGGFVLDLFTGILYFVVGLLIVTHPAGTATTLTLLIAMFLMFSGIFRLAVAAMVRFHHAFWLLLHGILNLVLGILIWQQWPSSGLWIIGLFIGIEMIFHGWTLIMLGLMAKNLPLE